ncbi:hypothetical protein [Saccharopolyspora kobensis]|uniref:hypothetical protein n=1 Tax=Saccharopolyspora kobensis TaxID=146035 RepID=UPI00331D5483
MVPELADMNLDELRATVAQLPAGVLAEMRADMRTPIDTDIRESSVGMIAVSVFAAFLELLAWVVAAAADFQPMSAPIFLTFVVPVLAGALGVLLSLIYIFFSMMEVDWVGALAAAVGACLCLGVVLTSLHFTGLITLL